MNPSLLKYYSNMARAKYEREELLKRSDISLKDWWGNATQENPDTAYHRFLDIYRLICDEEYTTEGNAIGSYAEQACRYNRGEGFRLLHAVTACAYRMGYLPDWLDEAKHIPQFLAYANDDTNGVQANLFYAIEVRDVRNMYGYKLGTKLRMAAAHISENLDYDNRDRRKWFNYLPRGTRACTFMKHTADKEIRADAPQKLGNGFSPKSIFDHLIENTGSAQELIDLVELYVNSINYVYYTPSQRDGYLKQLKKRSDAKNPMAMYLYGKILVDHDISGPNKKTQSLKLWHAAAAAGNAFAMAALALTQRDDGSIFTAIQWWKNALRQCFMPEASYNIGVFYGHGEDSVCPLDYTEAAHFYAHTVDCKFEKENARLDYETCAFLLIFGPNNDEQEEYITLATSNLRWVENKCAQGWTGGDATILNPKANPAFSCAVCGRKEHPHETKLLKCTRCDKVRYCNVICQKGHWPVHKSMCCVTIG